MNRKVKHFFRILGPGVITGAADDDPSGIATYSIAGAQFGTQFLWTAFLTWPLMGCVQMMCARIGLVRNEGLAAALSRRFPRPILILIGFSLLFANILNIGADLSAMADAAHMLTGISSAIWLFGFAILISWCTVVFPYKKIARILKWFCLFLFAYVITAFLLKPDWLHILRATFIPEIPKTSDEWSILVAILGTTISPYLFFWQTSEEVEEKASRRRAAPVQDREVDIGVGTFFSNFIMYFIILTTASSLHKSGVTHIETSQQAAEALRPLAGNFAYFLYTFGLIGVGLLAIPTLTGSAAYALSDIFGWKFGLNKKIEKAKGFYLIILSSMGIGVALNFAHIPPVKALYWSAIVNGLLSPFLMVGILFISCSSKWMNEKASPRIEKILGVTATILMFAAGIGMFIF